MQNFQALENIHVYFMKLTYSVINFRQTSYTVPWVFIPSIDPTLLAKLRQEQLNSAIPGAVKKQWDLYFLPNLRTKELIPKIFLKYSSSKNVHSSENISINYKSIALFREGERQVAGSIS